MKAFFQSTWGRCLLGLVVWLVLFPLAVPSAVFAFWNMAIALAIAGFDYLVKFIEGPDYQGAVPVDLFGMSPTVFLIVQGAALVSALLLLVSPFVIGLALAAAWRRVLITTSITALVLQAVCMIILHSNTYLTFTWDGNVSSPGSWGFIGITLYFGLACWGFVGEFSRDAFPIQPPPLRSEPPAGASE